MIDFTEYEVKKNTCYIVYPQQIHLLNRAPGSHGFLVQFQEDSLFSVKLQKLLKQRKYSGQQAVLFENDEALKERTLLILNTMRNLDKETHFATSSQLHLLHALLFELLSSQFEVDKTLDLDPDYYQFQSLLENHFKEHQTVAFYLSKLEIGEKKLSSLCKKIQGQTPLQVIHHRILLESKRLLVFEDRSHKEIAYELGFDSPASFSAFIKKKTGLTATELSKSLV